MSIKETLGVIFRAHPWLLLVTLFTAMLALHGISESDRPDFLDIARNTLEVLAPVHRQFLYSSPLNFMIGDFLGVPTVFGFFLIHGGEVLVLLAVVVLCVQKKFPAKDEQLRFYGLLSLTPLWLITLKWLGKPDPILVSLLFLCWAYPGRWRWLFAAVMVIAHREMGTVMCLFLLLSEETPDISLCIPLAIGYAFHYVYEHLVLNVVPSSRVEDITINLGLHPMEFARRPVLYFLGSLSWYWLVVLWQRPGVRLACGLLGAFAVAVVSEDFTRDFILMALAPILFHLESVVRAPSSAALMRFVPLGLLQIQIAAMGVVFKPGNLWTDWIVNGLGDQLSK